MAELSETNIKKYPHKEDDIKYEKEIVDAIKKLPLEQRFQAIALNNYVLLRKQLDAEVESQIQTVVRKYNKLQAPHLAELNNIISGKRAPLHEEVSDANSHLTPEELEQINGSLTAAAIPDYWFKVLTSCIRLSEDIEDTDHELLKKILTIEHLPEDESDDFTIKFTFAPNDYIENETLTVKFEMIDENEPAKTIADEIKWKEGKDVTKKTVTKKQKNKKTGQTRTVTKTVDNDSFFNLFKSQTAKDDDDEDDDEEKGMEALGGALDIAYNIALTLQDEIVPYHLEYYLGLRTGDEDDDEFPGIDEEDEDDEDDEEDERPKKGKGAKGKAGGDAPKQECKQQ